MNEKALKKKAHDYVMNHYDSEGYGTCLGKLEENAYMAGYKVAIADVNAAIDAIFEKLAEREKGASNSEFMELWGGAMALSDLRRSIDTLPEGLSGDTEDFSDFDRSIDEFKKTVGNDVILKDAAMAHENSIPKNIRLHPRVSFVLGAIWQKERMMKDAVGAEISYWNQTGLSILPDKPLERIGYNESTRVKIIIVRED